MVGHVTLTALAEESRTLSGVLRGLAAADLDRPTNCPPWSLAELVVHIGMSIEVGDDDPPPAAPGRAPASAADYYRRPERDTYQYRQANVDRTQIVAAEILTGLPAGSSVADWFDEAAAAAVAELGRRDLDQVVALSGVGPMRLADWVATRVISVAAHGLDVALTLGRPFWTSQPALQTITPVLVSLLGNPPPAQLRWDDQTLLAVGTGRRPLTDDERTTLGDAQHLFPLLS
jgi:uncharacterized protein (TIGR03083 family)